MENKLKRFLSLALAIVMVVSMLPTSAFATESDGSNNPVASANATNVAKVGNTEYATIDEAIANWTNGTTLTLLADVTLSDVITLKSTEHHILNLGTYTMTAASGKNAVVIKACGTGDGEKTAITIKADATNPGGINAGKNCVIYYKYADGGISGNDRPIIKIEGGVFTGSTSSFGTAGIYTIGKEARKCATLNISGGTFNCTINGSTKSKLIITGGTFNYSVGSQGDSTALRLISGGKFKTLGFMTADDNNTKFWLGTSMANSNVGLYVDKDGYLVIGGPVITELSAKYPAVASNYSKWSSYLKYSAAATYGLFYEDPAMAIAKHGEANVTIYEKPAVTIPENVTGDADVVEEIKNNTALKDYAPENLPEGAELEVTLKEATEDKIVFEVLATAEPTAETVTFRLPIPASVTEKYVKVSVEALNRTSEEYVICEVKGEGNAKYVEVVTDTFGEFTVEPTANVAAKIGDVCYETIQAAINAAQNGATVTILPGEYSGFDISNKNITIQGTVGANGELLTTIKGGNPAITGHNFNGTIKDLKIVDAFKVMYAEPAGNVTVDNVYVTGATYGFHLVAYGTDLTWTIQNSYMDLSWANSFGVYGNGDAAIVIKNNEFAATNPYYPDYGALAVNTFLPNVTVTGNVFGENAKIFIDDSVTDTSKINISKNYHADGVDKAFAVDEDGGQTVGIYEYYKDETLTELADTRPVKIGNTYYATLAEAIAVAKTMTGDVVVEINDEVTLNAPLTGSFDSIKFVGKDTDAEIYLDVQGYIEAPGKKVAFEDLILSKAEGGYIGNAGFMNLAFGIYGANEVTYTNCVFANGAYASSGKNTFTGCTFYRSHDRYGLWAYGAQNIVVDGCTFADIRGIKMYDEGKAGTTSITVKNTDFSAVNNKPAIVLTYGESVTLEGNTYSSTGVFELDLDGAPNGVAVTSDVLPTCVNDNGVCGVLVDGKIYTTVEQAAEVATSGSTVTLLHDSAETVELPEGVNLVKNGFVAAGVTVKVPNYVAQIGDSYYETLEEAIAAAASADGAVRIVLLCDSAMDSVINTEDYYYVTNDLTIGTADGANYTVSGCKIAICLQGGAKLTIEETVTIENLEVLANGFGTSGENLVINGTVKALSLKQWTSNGTITVGTTGSVWLGYGDGQLDMAYGNGAIVINGTLTDTSNLAGVDPQFKAGYSGTRGNGNTLTLNNTYFEAGAWFNVNGSNVTINVNNSVLKVSGGDNSGSLTVAAGNVIYVNEGSILDCADITINEGAKIVINGGILKATNVTNNGAIEVYGESTIIIDALTGNSIDLCHGAIVKDSTIGGKVFVAGNVTFRGKNSVVMLSDFGTLTDYYGTEAPMAWTIEKGGSLTLTDKSRYGLGYGDNVTIYGSLEDALSARDGLTEDDVVLFMHGLVAQESKGWDCVSVMTVKDAYVVIGSNNSFGNKPGNYGGTYTFNFENVVLDASRITFYEALSTTTFTFKNSDVKIGTFMTNDTDSVFELINSVILSTATANGNDEGNYNAGKLKLTNSKLTYSVVMTNKGEIVLDINSRLVAPAIKGDGKIVINAAGLTGDTLVVKADMSGFTGTIEVVGASGVTCNVTDEGIVVAKKTLPGSGTEADPYLIKNAEDLVLFRDSVNAGETKYNAPGVYVALGADIDLTDIDWSVNIGDDCSATFDGIFDGKGYTIKNLTSTESAQKGDGYICTGLFGAIYGSAVIKNLTIDNAQINAEYVGNNAGIVVGFAYSCTGSIENVKVTNSTLNAAAVTGTGAIVGYDYYGKLTIKDCVVENTDIIGKSYVGGIIGYGSNNCTVTGCAFTDGDVTANGGCAGGIAGIFLDNAKVENCIVKNANIKAENENWQNSAAVVVGTITSKVTVSGVTVENVNLTAMVGSVSAEKPTAPVAKVAAKIGNTYYATLQAAAHAAKAGDTIILLADIKLLADITVDADNTILIPSGANLVLDLNGFILTGESDETGSNRNMFDVRGTLTVQNGTISYTHKGANMGWGSSTNVFNVTAGGVLNIQYATVENNGGSDMNFVAHLNNWGEVTLNVKNSVLKAGYIPVRVFNSGNDMNNVTIENSTLESTAGNRVFWVHNFINDLSGTAAETVEARLNFNIFGNGNTFKVYNVDANRLFEYGFTNAINLDANGNYVARNEWALNYALSKGGKVTLGADLNLSSVLLIDKSITIDGNGHKVTSSASRVIRLTTSNIDVTINDLNMVNTKASSYTADIRGISIDAGLSNVKLTLNNCSVDFTDATACDWSYAVNVSGNGTGHVVTVNGGTYEGANVINAHGANNTIVVKNATLNCLYPNSDSYAGACIWVLQNQGSSVEATGNTFNGTNALAFNVGTGTTVTESNNTDNTTYVVAKIGDAYYTSLADAIAAAHDGDTVKLLADVNEAVTISGKKITLDLNGKKISGGNTDAVSVNNGANVTIKNGTLETYGTNCGGVWVKNATALIENCTINGLAAVEPVAVYASNGATVTIKDSVLTAKDNGTEDVWAVVLMSANVTVENSELNGFHAASGNGSDGYDQGKLTIVNGDLNGLVYWPAQGKLTINGGEIDEILMKSGSLSVSGGTIGKIEIENVAEGGYEAIENVTISGGTIGDVKLSAGASLTAPAGLTVTTVDGYKVVYADGVYASVESNYIVSVNGVKYETLTEMWDAIKAASQAGDEAVVKFLKDLTISEYRQFEYGTGNIIFTADTPVTVTLKKDFDFVSGNIAIKVEENVTLNVYDNAGGIYVYYGPGLYLEGTIGNGQNWGCLYLAYGEHTITETGKAQIARLQLAWTSLTVNGQIDNKYILVEESTLDLNGAIVNTGYFTDTNNGGLRYGASVITAINGTVINANKFELKHANSQLKIDLSSSLTAGTVLGNGKIVIDITGFDGNAVQVITADMSAFNGTIEVINGYAVVEVTSTGVIVKKPVAQIGDQYFATLADAIAAAQAGETIVMLADIELTEVVIIAAGQEVVLDLNGKTISGTETETLTANDALIRITKGGKLTIKDSSEEKTGTITYGYTGEATGWSGYSASTIENNQGTLIVESGKIVSTTNMANQIAYTINTLTNGNIGDAYVCIVGGEIVAEGSTAIRQFANSTSCTNTLVIEGGKITGRVQLQSSNANNNKGVLTITGGEIIREGNTAIEVWFSGGANSACSETMVSIGGAVKVTGNVVFDEAPEAYNEKVISGGTFTTDVSEFVVDGYQCKDNGNGAYGVEEKQITAKIIAKSGALELKDMVSICYTFHVIADDADVAEYGLLIFADAQSAADPGNNIASEIIMLVDTKKTGEKNGEATRLFEGVTAGISARNMGKLQYAVGYLKLVDGTVVYAPVVEYSPLKYCTNMVNKASSSAETKMLCKALMQYGAAAQVAQDGVTSGLMNEGFEAVEYNEAVLGTEVFSVDTTPTNGFTTKSAQLELKGAISYVVKYAVDEGIANKKLYAEYTIMGQTDSVEMALNGNRYEAFISGISARNMDETIVIKPYYIDENGEKVYGAELVYSGYEYVRRIVRNSTNADSIALAKALAMYIDAANTALK